MTGGGRRGREHQTPTLRARTTSRAASSYRAARSHASAARPARVASAAAAACDQALGSATARRHTAPTHGRAGTIQTHDVAHFLDQQRIGREVEGLAPVGLQSEGLPNAPDRRVTETDSLRHRPRAPVCRVGGLRLVPDRYSSCRPASRFCTKRLRHLPTVWPAKPMRAATALLSSPSAQASTILARSANRWAVLPRRLHRRSVSFSADESTNFALGRPVLRLGAMPIPAQIGPYLFR
jgi:hypothetical protein